MSRSAWKGWIAIALIACAPSPAGASMIRVDYRVSTNVEFRGTPVGPPGPQGSGRISLLYAAPPSLPTGASGPSLPVLAGPAALSGGRLQAAFTQLQSHLPSSMAAGGIQVRLTLDLGNAPGTLRSTGALLLPAIPVAQRGLFNCVGSCSGMFTQMIPLTAAFQDAWTAPGHLVSGALHAGALASLSLGRNGILLASGLGIHITDAQEIARYVVPEPGSLPLVASGLALLAAFAGVRRRARYA